VWVEIEEFETPETKTSKVPTIRAVIHIDSNSRKRILVGRAGNLIKEIGIGARKEIEKLLGHQICLKLFVDVQDSWKNDKRIMSQYLELT
jgi:GTPase